MSDQTKYTNKLHNNRILVIGGSSGIGYAAAECLLEHGAAAIIISSSNPSKVTEKVKALQSSYPSKASRVSGFACSLSDQANLDANVKKLLEQATENGQHKLDHIVHTAGDPLHLKPVQEITMPELVQAGMVRFFSTLMVCKHAQTFMNPGPESSIILTTGTVSERPIQGWGAPAGFATGLHGVTRAMALDLAPLRVVLVSPGAVDTELWNTLGLNEDQKQGMIKQFGSGMTTGQVPGPSEIAEAYLYAIKDKNLTGTVISTNGGALLKGPAR